MKKLFILILLIQFPFMVTGQTNAVIEKMRKERAEMEEQIARQEKILTSTEKDIASQISNLNIITARLKERTTILEKTRSEVRSLDRESSRLNKEIEQLEKEHEQCKERYDQACKFFQRQNSNFNPLTFILASQTFQEMRRRARYVGEYSSSLYEMADEISQKRDTLLNRREQVELLKQEKVELEKVQQEYQAAVRRRRKTCRRW